MANGRAHTRFKGMPGTRLRPFGAMQEGGLDLADLQMFPEKLEISNFNVRLTAFYRLAQLFLQKSE